MKERKHYSHVPARLKGYARISKSLRDEPRFSMGFTSTAPSASLEGAKLPAPVIAFLSGLDHKLDMILSQQSLAVIERDYPIIIDVREVSGNGIRFKPTKEIPVGTPIEVVLMLRYTPLRLAAAKGLVTLEENARFCTCEFSKIRDDDLETLVAFVFEEERQRIRSHKRCG